MVNIAIYLIKWQYINEYILKFNSNVYANKK